MTEMVTIKCKALTGATDIFGAPVIGPDGKAMNVSLKELLGALGQMQEFIGITKGVEAVSLSADAGRLIRGLDESKDEFEMPADVLEGFRRALKAWEPPARFAHCFADMVLALSE